MFTFPRRPEAERAWSLQFSKGVLKQHNGRMQAAGCKIAAASPTAVRITGHLDGEAPFLLVLEADPAGGDVLCKGELAVHGRHVAKLAVYVVTPSSIRVRLLVAGTRSGQVGWGANSRPIAELVGDESFSWNTATDFIVITGAGIVNVPKPSAPHRDLWVVVSAEGVECMAATRTVLTTPPHKLEEASLSNPEPRLTHRGAA